MLYSVGKDSSVMVRLAQKAFYPGKIPFPLLHVDTGYKFKEMYEFRDQFTAQIGARLLIHRNQPAIAGAMNPWQFGTDKCCGALKTGALLQALETYGFDAAFGGDENAGVAEEARRKDGNGDEARILAAQGHAIGRHRQFSDIEFSMIKTHSQVGYEIVKDIEFPWPIAAMILQHHERLDGSGYPQGLQGDDILPDAKILAVADVVEAMASHRPYRPALEIGVALEEIAQQKGGLYDPAVVDARIKLFTEKGFQFDEKL